MKKFLITALLLSPLWIGLMGSTPHVIVDNASQININSTATQNAINSFTPTPTGSPTGTPTNTATPIVLMDQETSQTVVSDISLVGGAIVSTTSGRSYCHGDIEITAPKMPSYFAAAATPKIGYTSYSTYNGIAHNVNGTSVLGANQSCIPVPTQGQVTWVNDAVTQTMGYSANCMNASGLAMASVGFTPTTTVGPVTIQVHWHN